MRLTKQGTTRLVSTMSYSDAFGQPTPVRPFDLLQAYPTDLLLLRISKINAILYMEEDIATQNDRCLKEVVFQDVPASHPVIMQLSSLMSRSHQGAFSAPVMSLIIKDALENYTEVVPEQMVNAVTFAGDLFKAILSYNEHYYEGRPGVESFEDLFGLDVKQQYYLRRERSLKLDMLFKFAFISKFLSDDEILRKPALEYCRALEIGTVWGLAKFFLFLFSRLLSREKTANHILLRNGADWPVMEQYVLHKADLLPHRKFSLHKDIIPKPLYEYDSNHLILLDYNYFTYGLDQGILYSIFGKSSLRDKKIFKDYNAYKGYIGLHYFEQFFVGDFIRHIFSRKNHHIISNEKYQDYIVRVGNNIFVIEVKMTDFNANGLESESFSDFTKFLNENFLNFKQEGQGKNKGLAQILRQVGHLANDTELQQALHVKHLKRINVYPVVIYSDANLEMNGVNEYIIERSQEHLVPYKNTFQKIQPVTMVGGSFFTLYYRHLRQKPAILAEWLDAYIKSVSSMKKRYQESKDARQYLLYNKSFAEHMRRKLPHEQLGLNLEVIKNDFQLDVQNFGESIA